MWSFNYQSHLNYTRRHIQICIQMQTFVHHALKLSVCKFHGFCSSSITFSWWDSFACFTKSFLAMHAWCSSFFSFYSHVIF
jgi:hypothetical protein